LQSSQFWSVTSEGSGYLGSIKTGDGESNTLRIYSFETKIMVFINGNYTTEFNFPTNLVTDNIWVVTSLSNLDGYQTDYKDFAVWKIP